MGWRLFLLSVAKPHEERISSGYVSRYGAFGSGGEAIVAISIDQV
jgi:hypothetical protein